MKTDLYTKLILTIIAVALSIIVFQNLNLISPAKAGGVRTIGMIPVNEDGSIDVRVKQMPSDVLDVNIESCDRMAFYHAEPIEVKLDQ